MNPLPPILPSGPPSWRYRVKMENILLVLCGGSWFSLPSSCRSVDRIRDPAHRFDNRGFRVFVDPRTPPCSLPFKEEKKYV